MLKGAHDCKLERREASLRREGLRSARRMEEEVRMETVQRWEGLRSAGGKEGGEGKDKKGKDEDGSPGGSRD